MTLVLTGMDFPQRRQFGLLASRLANKAQEDPELEALPRSGSPVLTRSGLTVRYCRTWAPWQGPT